MYLDRLLSYPDVGYLSGCWLPIRVMAESAGSGNLSISLGSGLCCWHFVKRVPVLAEGGVPVTGARRRLTPERRHAVGLVLDTGATDRICGRGLRAPE